MPPNAATNQTLQGMDGTTSTTSSSINPIQVHFDQAILATFPEGTKVISSSIYASSQWSSTYRFKVELLDRSQPEYFMKTQPGEHGRSMFAGEFLAMSEVYKFTPHFTPKPHAFGRYVDEDIYFFITQFVAMEFPLPEPKQLGQKLAQLAHTSISPTGMLGMDLNNCQGPTLQALEWESTWTGFFTKFLQHGFDRDAEINGCWENLDILSERLISHVIPRLIGALEANGRTVKPCLIHGDIWEGNIGTNPETGDLYIFDCASFYGHHEAALGQWRSYYNRMFANRAEYMKMYFEYFPPSEPVEEWDDRNLIYNIYYDVMFSCGHKQNGKAIRQM